MSFNNTIRFCCVECGDVNIRAFNQNEKDKIDIEDVEILDSYICDSCQTVYKSINGIPCFLSKEDQDSELFQRYFRNYRIIAADDIEEDIMPEEYKKSQTDKLVNYAGNKIHQKVLDLGVGKGYFLERIPHNNKIGVDISIEYLNILKTKKIACVMANAENLPFSEEFDLIILSDILEHVFNPVKVLDCVHKALKPGGKAIIRVPYKEDISQYSPDKGCKYEFVHLRSFDEKSLLQMIEQSALIFNKFEFDGFLYYKLRGNGKNNMMSWLSKIIAKYFDQSINRMPNFLGCLFFQPIEIVAICRK